MHTHRIAYKWMLIVIILLSGCSAQTEIVRLYEDRADSEKVFRRLLIVDVASDIDRRRFFEDEIVKVLHVEGVDAVSSYEEIRVSDGVTQDELHALGLKLSADGVLITHFVSVQTSADVQEGRDNIVSVCRRGDPLGYFLYDHSVLHESDTVKIAHTVVVATDLYDVRAGKRVWGIQSTCFDKANMNEVLVDEANAIVRQLRIDGYVK